MVVTSVSTGADKAYAVAYQGDGKVMAVGYSTGTLTGKDFALVRYNSDGSLDTDFGVGGKVTIDVQQGSDDIAYDVIIQTDGKIVVAGTSDDGANANGALMRYLEDGTVDTDFGTNGIVITDFISNQQDEIHVLKYNAVNGHLIVGGNSITSSMVANAIIARYLETGELDTNFNGTGILPVLVEVNDAFRYMIVEDLVVTTNGKISAIGWKKTTSPLNNEYWACRVLSNGNLDTTFSDDGALTYDEAGTAYGYGLCLDGSGNYYISGSRSYNGSTYCRWLKVNTNGTISNPSTMYNNGGDDEIAYAIEMDTEGKLVMACTSTTGSNSFMFAVRVGTDGVLDNTFNGTGYSTFNFPGAALDDCQDLLIQPDTKIVLVGSADNDFAILRLLGELTAQLTEFDLQLPANNATAINYSSVNFNWTDAPLVTGYEIDIDTNIDFSTALTYSSVASSTSLSNLLPNTMYYWRVRATDGTNWDTNDIVFSFTTNTLENFTLITPVDNATNISTIAANFDWSDAAGATHYEFNISTSATFDVDVQILTVDGSDTIVTDLLPNTLYYWRVRAFAGDVAGEYSDVWNFTTLSLDNFNLQTPIDNAVNISFAQITLNWTNLTGATEYELQIDVNSDFSSASTLGTITSDYNFTPLAPATTYYWRVRAGDGINWGSYTDGWSFTTLSLDAIALSAPANNALNQTPASLQLTFVGVSGADAYELQVDMVSDFSTSGNTISTSTVNNTLTNLQANATYYWRARAGYNNAWGDWTEAWQFTTSSGIAVFEINEMNDIMLYPNPMKESFIVQIPAVLVGSSYEITNALGSVVKSGLFNRMQTEIHLTEESSGIYFLIVNKSNTDRIRIVKQ